MSLSRREFVKLCTGTVAGIGVSRMFHPEIVQALQEAATGKKPPVIWLQGTGCTGCSVSLLNTVHPTIAEVLLKVISLEYHPTVMGSEGEMALENMFHVAEANKGKFFLAVEGAIPVAEDGIFCVIGERHGHHLTMMQAMKELGSQAAGVLALGACGTSGGIPGAKGSITQSLPVTKFFASQGIKTPVINIPGCPPHPDWIVGTIAHVLTHGIPELDDQLRPKMFFKENIHSNCPYLKQYEEGKFQTTFTDKSSCRASMGCKGPLTNSDCFKRKWNNGVNWCVDNAICHGCVELEWPDGMAPFYAPIA